MIAIAGTPAESARTRSRLEEMLMSPMHPVEVADGDIRAASPGGKLTNVLDRDHQRAASLLEPAISTRRPEHP